ncbi:crotonobetainyl-CoA:carnitine CoA-transferase CaiB-like acyl-CoA transferase [Azospirillum fermentarium]|uniref:CaiB/BaiF CoA transferase family protein n=1 Tax=Azospirillum fermentarium TaxID=1233114 RepID=UPI002226B5F1|nr:CaiB/BaiF CoA-transferase family protein [Azospirillum fermentarium]MCW2247607.1 crotonobetainyl-CoA:carnitine CoA-transferase CaiB-like acyl-CoA transferase [Azospirillum fermentarium]
MASAHPADAAVPVPRPLAGVRVVELDHMVMGPACGMILADLGADVVKVEPLPAGDKTRTLTGSGAGFFVTYNRNKRSVAVDLTKPDGQALVRRLVETADVLVENLRPGALERMGLGYAALSALNPRLIFCSLKGFLPGPYEHRTALDEVVQMMGGLAYMTGPPGRPLRAGASVNDVMGGLFAAVAVLAALRERDMDGRGRQVRAGLFENNVFLMGQHMAQAALTGRPVAPMPARQAAWAIYDVFTTGDGEQLFLGVVSDGQWRAFCTRFKLESLRDDPELATNPQRVAARPRILPAVARVFLDHSARGLVPVFEELGLPYAPIVKPEDLFDDPHLRQSGGLMPVTPPNGGPAIPLPALPVEIDGARPGLYRDVPRFGEHTRDLLAELGLDDDAIARLLQDGIIAAPSPSLPQGDTVP